MLGLKLDRWAGGWADDPPSSHLDSNPRWRGQWKPLLQSPIEIQTKVDPKVRNHGDRQILTQVASRHPHKVM